jgi:hypothetical protein
VVSPFFDAIVDSMRIRKQTKNHKKRGIRERETRAAGGHADVFSLLSSSCCFFSLLVSVEGQICAIFLIFSFFEKKEVSDIYIYS